MLARPMCSNAALLMDHVFRGDRRQVFADTSAYFSGGAIAFLALLASARRADADGGIGVLPLRQRLGAGNRTRNEHPISR